MLDRGMGEQEVTQRIEEMWRLEYTIRKVEAISHGEEVRDDDIAI
jgi:hypothetical protein